MAKANIPTPLGRPICFSSDGAVARRSSGPEEVRDPNKLMSRKNPTSAAASNSSRPERCFILSISGLIRCFLTG